DASSANTEATAPDRVRNECSSHGRRETGGEIVFTEAPVARHLRPIGEGRLVETELIVEVGNDVIAALDHFARCLCETRLVAVDQRQAPCPDHVKQDAASEE